MKDSADQVNVEMWKVFATDWKLGLSIVKQYQYGIDRRKINFRYYWYRKFFLYKVTWLGCSSSNK